MPHRRASSSSAYSSSPSSSSPPVKKGKRKYGSYQKLHAVVVCEHEKVEAQSLRSIRTSKLIRYVRPVGKKPEGGKSAKLEGGKTAKPRKEPELQSLGCKILQGIPAFLRTLHKKGYCLKGKLNVNKLCWVKSSKSVKLRRDAIDDLKQYTDDDDGRMDYTSISTSLRDDLFRGHILPKDLQAWLDLMLDDPFKHTYLIRRNIALLHRRSKLNHFLSLYEILEQVRKLSYSDHGSSVKYYSVVDNIPVGTETEQYVWTSYAMDNKYVKMVYDFKRGGRKASAFGLLTFVKDCIHHLLDYSLENNVIMFTGVDKYLMIETCFRGVFHQFQRAMADAGLTDSSLEEEM